MSAESHNARCTTVCAGPVGGQVTSVGEGTEELCLAAGLFPFL